MMRRPGPIVGLILIAIYNRAGGFSLLNDPSLESLLDPDDAESSSVGCESYGSPYWEQIERAARLKLRQIKGLKERSGEREMVRERRDSYGHDDTQVVVRCKHGYTGGLYCRYIQDSLSLLELVTVSECAWGT